MSTKSSHDNIACIIPTLHNREGTRQLLSDLAAHHPSIPVIVVNNNTEPFTSSVEHPSLIIVEERGNTGFAKACNDGARAAEKYFHARYLAFINDDIRFTHPWLDTCVTELEKRKWFATTPLINQLDGTPENIGYRVLPQGKILLVKSLNRTSSDLDGLTAAALVVRYDVFKNLRGFDERFFAYLEDVDLFLRAKKLGYKFGTTQSVSVTHRGQGTSSSMPVRKRWLDLRNWYLLILKNWDMQTVVKYLPQIAIERIRNISGLMKALLGFAK